VASSAPLQRMVVRIRDPSPLSATSTMTTPAAGHGDLREPGWGHGRSASRATPSPSPSPAPSTSTATTPRRASFPPALMVRKVRAFPPRSPPPPVG
jgi:hypothetical protein